MSSASIPPPRTSPSSSSRHNYFWPILIYMLGAGALSFYQVQSLEDQLVEVQKATDRLDSTEKDADYQKGKFFAMARELVRLAPKDAAAEKIVEQTGLRTLERTQPLLMSLGNPSGLTNTAPVDPGTILPPGAANASNAPPFVPAPDAK